MSNPQSLPLRIAGGADAAPLAAFAARLFHETYDAFNRAEDMRAYIDLHFTADRLREDLESGAARTLVAEAEGRITAYATLRPGPAPACVTGVSPVELARLYVDAAWQGTGLAARLLARCREEAGAWRADVLWLSAWKENERALRFYRKHGFEAVGTRPFRLGDEVQEDLVLTCRLALAGEPLA